MAHHKGTTLVLIRKILHAQGPDFEKKVLDQITEPERRDYEQAQVVFWYPVYETIEDDQALVAVAGKELFPNDPEPLRQFGKAAANYAIHDFYKALFRIPSINALMRLAPMLWRTYNDTGAFYVENFSKQDTALSVSFLVRHYSVLPRYVREFLSGYYTALLEWTGAKYVEVIRHDDYKRFEAWQWDIKANY